MSAVNIQIELDWISSAKLYPCRTLISSRIYRIRL